MYFRLYVFKCARKLYIRHEKVASFKNYIPPVGEHLPATQPTLPSPREQALPGNKMRMMMVFKVNSRYHVDNSGGHHSLPFPLYALHSEALTLKKVKVNFLVQGVHWFELCSLFCCKTNSFVRRPVSCESSSGFSGSWLHSTKLGSIENI